MRTYGWASVFSWGLTLSGAALALGGVVGAFAPDWRGGAVGFCVLAAAVMMACAIACTNLAASSALRAMRRKRVVWAVLLPALAVCGGLGFVAQLGTHLGWDVLKSNGEVAVLPEGSLSVALWITAFAKPVMAMLIEGMKSLDDEDEAAKRAARNQAVAAPIAANDTADLDAARERRHASVDAGHPPLTQSRVDEARDALVARCVPVSQAAIARELTVSKDRIHRAVNRGEIRLAA